MKPRQSQIAQMRRDVDQLARARHASSRVMLSDIYILRASDIYIPGMCAKVRRLNDGERLRRGDLQLEEVTNALVPVRLPWWKPAARVRQRNFFRVFD